MEAVGGGVGQGPIGQAGRGGRTPGAGPGAAACPAGRAAAGGGGRRNPRGRRPQPPLPPHARRHAAQGHRAGRPFPRRTGGAAVQYMYFPEKQNACGDDYPYDSGNGPIAFQPGTWHTVEHRIVMNTPGAHDGIIEAWFDGKQALSNKTFLYRLAGATFGIDTLYFSTFFGGSDSTWAPSAPQIADFDDFIVSTGPITH